MQSSLPSAARRNALFRFGAGVIATAAATSATGVSARVDTPSERTGGSDHGELARLGDALARAPRRRQFQSTPFMVTEVNDWDHEAAQLLLDYRYKARQVWEPIDPAGPWPGLMREAISGQVFAHHNSQFLAVAAVHGNAHVVLFSESMWQKYRLPGIIGGALTSNSVLLQKTGTSPHDSHEDVNGFYGPYNSNIVSLQQRGAVFVACHDSIHAIARKLSTDPAYASSSADQIAADLTNNLIEGAVLVPSVVAFIVELQRVGFTYAKG